MCIIYYSDGTEYEYKVGDNPPARDVQLILQVDPVKGPYFQSGDDFYIWIGDRWLGVDVYGLYDRLEEKGLIKPKLADVYTVKVDGEWIELHNSMAFYQWLVECPEVLLGRTISNEDYAKIYYRAKEEKKKYTSLPRERVPRERD